MKRPLTPQEKKANRYDRDHVTLGWKTGTKFRKKWRDKEVTIERSHRRAWNAVARDLAQAPGATEDAPSPRRRSLRKPPPPSVRELVETKHGRRERSYGAKGKRRARRADQYDAWIEREIKAILLQKTVGNLDLLRSLQSYVCARMGALVQRKIVIEFLQGHPTWMKRLVEWRQKLWAEHQQKLLSPRRARRIR